MHRDNESDSEYSDTIHHDPTTDTEEYFCYGPNDGGAQSLDRPTESPYDMGHEIADVGRCVSNTERNRGISRSTDIKNRRPTIASHVATPDVFCASCMARIQCCRICEKPIPPHIPKDLRKRGLCGCQAELNICGVHIIWKSQWFTIPQCYRDFIIALLLTLFMFFATTILFGLLFVSCSSKK